MDSGSPLVIMVVGEYSKAGFEDLIKHRNAAEHPTFQSEVHVTGESISEAGSLIQPLSQNPV